jgi:lysophospholipase L1-like esterase
MHIKLHAVLFTLLALIPNGASASRKYRALHPNDVILFQGDSITDGGRQRTGSDFNHIMGQDYAYMLAGELGMAFPERNLVFLNRGISGDRILDLIARWQTDTIALHPNLISILVGINDAEASGTKAETVEQFEADYDALLAETIAALPNAKIVLGEPFLLPVGKRVAKYQSERQEVAKRQAVVARLAAKYHVPEVLYQKAFDEASKRAPADHWSWDGIHPTYAGHALMSQLWLRAVDAAWPRG